MPTYPTQDELRDADPLLPWIDEQFLRPDPYAFDGYNFRSFVSLISQELEVDPNGIYCIGSGAVGLSLNVKKMTDEGQLHTFSESSDLDIAVISEVLFETAWRDLRLATQPTTAEVDAELRDKMSWQKKRFFDGAILADKMLPWLSFGAKWTSSLVRISEQVAIQFGREVEVHIWIYRDYWSVRNYVSEGIMKCRMEIR
jgi:hypothetical protein